MTLFRRYAKIALHHERERAPVPIVADAAMAATNMADGRLVPLIIIDTSNRPDLEELIRVHGNLPPGDVETQWGTLAGASGRVTLILSFKKPLQAVAILEFDIVSQGILVDQILTARLLYLQAGRTGDRFITTPEAKRIFVEVQDTGFRQRWDEMFHKQIAKEMRRKGLGRQQAKRAAAQAIQEMRKFGKLRMGRK